MEKEILFEMIQDDKDPFTWKYITPCESYPNIMVGSETCQKCHRFESDFGLSVFCRNE